MIRVAFQPPLRCDGVLFTFELWTIDLLSPSFHRVNYSPTNTTKCNPNGAGAGALGLTHQPNTL